MRRFDTEECRTLDKVVGIVSCGNAVLPGSDLDQTQSETRLGPNRTESSHHRSFYGLPRRQSPSNALDFSLVKLLEASAEHFWPTASGDGEMPSGAANPGHSDVGSRARAKGKVKEALPVSLSISHDAEQPRRPGFSNLSRSWGLDSAEGLAADPDLDDGETIQVAEYEIDGSIASSRGGLDADDFRPGEKGFQLKAKKTRFMRWRVPPDVRSFIWASTGGR